MVPQYVLVILACEGCSTGLPVRNITGTILIAVTDVNDNAPRFESTLYQSSIPGDASIGSSVLVVKATDADTGLNAAVTYSIDYNSGNGSRLFVIDPMSGQISVDSSVAGIDGVVYFNVIAADRGQPPQYSYSTVQITVNSFRPRIVSPPNNVTILANTVR